MTLRLLFSCHLRLEMSTQYFEDLFGDFMVQQ